MISYQLLIGLILYSFVGSITPGPNNMMLMASGLNHGIRTTLPHINGIMFGNTVMVVAAGMGMLTVLTTAPLLYHVLHIGSILYLLYLAWQIATTDHISNDKKPPKKPMSFLQAFSFQWVNPKAIVIVMVIITTYVPDTPGWTYALNIIIVTCVDSLVLLPCLFAWTIFGNRIKRFLKDPHHFKIFNIAMALLLVLSLTPMLLKLIRAF